MPTSNRHALPPGLKPGDFIQGSMHFGDIFFEVEKCFESGGYWSITYIHYDKYGATPKTDWINSASTLRRVIPAEMAVPLMIHKNQRFMASFGQYDPFDGFAPAGIALRDRSN